MMPMPNSSARVGTKDYYLSKLEGNRSDNEIVVLITSLPSESCRDFLSYGGRWWCMPVMTTFVGRFGLSGCWGESPGRTQRLETTV